MGTNTQTAEPRVVVTGHMVAPCAELPNGFYAAKINPQTGADAYVQLDGIVIDAAKLPALIHDLQNVQIELSAQAMVDSMSAQPGALLGPTESADLMAELEAEEPATLSGAVYSGDVTGIVARHGDFDPLWDALGDPDSHFYAELNEDQLRALIRDFPGANIEEPAPGVDRSVLVESVKTIFVRKPAPAEPEA
jgi:hypothetical protein